MRRRPRARPVNEFCYVSPRALGHWFAAGPGQGGFGAPPAASLSRASKLGLARPSPSARALACAR